jgi:outer membrane protein OmpA-like peptidoglycan-associated protein
MRNLLTLFLLFASTLITQAQTEYKNSDFGVDFNIWENPAFDVVSLLEPSSTNTTSNEDMSIDLINESNPADNLTTESFVALHLNVIGLTTQSTLDAVVDIYHNSDFIKDYSGKVENGAFNIHLMDFGWYIISLTAPGYFEASDTVWVVSEKRKTIDRDVYLVPIEVGMKITNNINFNFDKTILSEQSLAELDKEVVFLNKNPNVIFEIAGHTDSDGAKEYNLLLSQRRAQAVVDYLVSQGADRTQLIARGYGDTRPLKSNGTKLDKANNRRVVFTVFTKDSNALAKQQGTINSQISLE